MDNPKLTQCTQKAQAYHAVNAMYGYAHMTIQKATTMPEK